MPSVKFTSAGTHPAGSSITVASNGIFQIYNSTQTTLTGVLNVGANGTPRVVDTEGRGPKGVEVLNPGPVGSVKDGTSGTAGADIELRMQPAGSIFIQLQAGSTVDFVANAMKPAHTGNLVTDQHLFYDLNSATV